jgi:hypothetical protein
MNVISFLRNVTSREIGFRSHKEAKGGFLDLTTVDRLLKFAFGMSE